MDCLSHHKICNAECCRYFSVRFTQKRLRDLKYGMTIRTKAELSEDMINYFILHGCDYNLKEKELVIVLGRFKYDFKNKRLIIFRKCNNLEGNLCTVHPDRKPKICTDLTEESVKNGSEPTPNCLLRKYWKV